MILPAAPLAVAGQVQVLQAACQMPLDPKATSNNIQMIASLVAQGVGIGVLTSLDVAAEVRAGTLAFTRIADPIIKPMTLALCTATSRTTSYAAEAVLAEIQHGFATLEHLDPAGLAL
jgi:DNA-binding transcriptional LysR family regulator